MVGDKAIQAHCDSSHNARDRRLCFTLDLNSLVIKTVVIPLPIVWAADFIEEVSKGVKTNKKRAIKYLEEVKRQLNIAQIFGYG